MSYKDFPVEALRNIVIRSTKDGNFRKWLRENPRAAILDETAIAVEADLQPIFVEKRTDALVVKLPPFQQKGDPAFTGYAKVICSGPPKPPRRQLFIALVSLVGLMAAIRIVRLIINLLPGLHTTASKNKFFS